jgi:tRNA A-37 threonylcarbamoyl transferase component Bud32
MSESVEMVLGGVRWQLPPQHCEQLFDADGLRLAEWLADGRARIVKYAPHRTIYRVALNGLSFYLKHYPLADLRGWLRQLVRPSKARTEYQRAIDVAARGVPTVVPLALGERCSRLGPADSFLLTYTLEGAEPLNDFVERLPALPPARQTHVRQRLAVAMAELVARMHEAGVLHNDLHAANLMVRLEEDDRPALYLIDLHAVRLGDPLDWRASHANLVMLNRWFSLCANRPDRLRFWHAYYRARGVHVRGQWGSALLGSAVDQPERLHVSALARDLESRTWASNLVFWRHRDRRCLVNNRYYRRVRTKVCTGHAVTHLDAGVLAALAADPDAPFRRAGVKLLKDSRSSTVAELEMSVSGSPRRVIYKRFRVTAWSDPLANLLRRHGAMRSWIYGHGLRERCLPTAYPLAVLSRRRHGLCHEGYLLTEKIENVVDLHAFLAGLDALPGRDRCTRLRRRIDRVAILVRELHRRCLSHRDLKAANILTATVANRADESVWFIDLVGIKVCRRLSEARRLQNLTRLHASFHHSRALTRTDKLRFLRVYLQWGLYGRGDWKAWWRRIERATLAKAARNLQRGRPLA